MVQSVYAKVLDSPQNPGAQKNEKLPMLDSMM